MFDEDHMNRSPRWSSTNSLPVHPAGWSGSGGLGAKEQGIQDPIKVGHVRDKWDQYKGVGVSLDEKKVFVCVK